MRRQPYPRCLHDCYGEKFDYFAVLREELKHDKPAEYERLRATGEMEKHMVDPFPAGVERGLKVFAFIALAVGLTLIGLILYARLFAYL